MPFISASEFERRTGRPFKSMNHRKKRVLVLVLVLVTLALAACAPPPNLRDNTLLQDTSLITGDPCAAPCFRGITPGVTEWSDALTILEDDSDFTNIQTQEDESTDAVQVAWQQGENQVCCQMATNDGDIVSLIFLRTAPEMTLAELIEAHGEPTYTIGSEFTADQAIMSVVYPDVPMVVYVFVAGPEEGILSEASEIIGALYFTPEDMELLLATQELHAWDGYKSYADYTASDFAVTPSITLTPTPAS